MKLAHSLQGAMMSRMEEGREQEQGKGEGAFGGGGLFGQEGLEAFASFQSVRGAAGGEAKSARNSNKNLGLLLVLLFGLVLPFLHILTPLLSSKGLEVTRLRDDAAYQFVVARNLAQGQGFSFDGSHSASGVQIAWTLVLSALVKVFGPSALPLLALLLGTLLFAASTLLAILLLQRFFGPRIALLLGALMASRGLIFAEAMNGQESSLALFALFLFAHLAFPHEGDSHPKSKRLRLLVILLPWIRTDLLLFPLGLALWPNIADRFGLPARPTRSNWIDLGLSLLVYFAGMLLLFGVALPPSGFALPWLFRSNFILGHPSLGAWISQLWWFFRPLLLGSPFLIAGLLPAMALAWWLLAPLATRQKGLPLFLAFLAFLLGASNLGALVLGALLLSLGLLPSRKQQLSFAGENTSATLLAFFLLAFLHLVIRWYPRDYYFVPILLPSLLSLGLLLQRWTSEEGLLVFIPKFLRDRIAYLVLLALGLSGAMPLGARFPWQEEMRFAGHWLNQVLPDHPPLGAFNAGWIAWEYQGKVQNLDGCVDGAALPALQQKRLLPWLQNQGTDLVLDSWRQLKNQDPDPHNPHASGPYLGPKAAKELIPLLAIDLPGTSGQHQGTGSLVLCKIQGSPSPSFPKTATLLGRDPKGRPILFLPRANKNAPPEIEIEGAKQGRHPMNLDPEGSKAPYLLTRIPGTHGRVFLPGGGVLEF